MGLKEKIKDVKMGYRPEILVNNWLNEKVFNQLKEYYRRPNLDWIHDLVDLIYDYESNYEVLEKYLDEKHIRIDFEPSSSKELILHAKYTPINRGYLFVFNDLLNDFIDNKSHKDELIIELKEFFIHEETHNQQDQLNHNKQPYGVIPENATVDQNIQYLSQFQEIDAFARGIAYEASQIYGSDDEAIKSILNKDFSKFSNKSKVALECYFYNGGKILRKFLTEIYRYFNEPNIINDKLAYKNYLHSTTKQ